ncbi:3-oxoacyl-[acyl-carrier-protein] reductase [Alicyclobacillus acidocaldarius]|uniref:3-oxoacyl-[acyl-carrier-protein] reductase n=1 Tax=Alicyclobacillus acidocaldarius TaxID=405212 RepID=UPI0005A19C87|nr:3-oxoacyl-[acyl-carrier-protein] reductase [Alicyclobacillus acidocaldarius]
MSDARVALVTGASRGIGRAIALELAAEGRDVIVNYRSGGDLAAEVVRAIEEMGRRAVAIQADVSKPEEAKRLVADGLAAMGRIDILVNNAGITRDGLLVRMSDDDFNQVLDTNLRGAFYLIREVARPMMKARWGAIVNITSVVGLMGNAGQANYAAAKAGLVGLTKATAKELAPRNITVNAVAPGYIDTDMTRDLGEDRMRELLAHIPLGRTGQAEEVAYAVAFLTSEKARYITGQVVAVDGGMAM